MSNAMELCVGAKVAAPNRKKGPLFWCATVLQSLVAVHVVHLVDCQRKPKTSEVCEETERLC